MLNLVRFEEKIRRCEYLAEDELKLVCEHVSSSDLQVTLEL